MQSDDELIEAEPLAADVYQAMKGVNCKQKEREDLERATEEFLRRKGRIVELRPDPTIADSLLF